MPTILMPALSPTMEEGKLAKWLKNVGDKVKPGDIIAEIETDKATMEVEAVDEGPLTSILVPAGTEGVKVNTPIAVIGEADAATPPPAKAPGTLPYEAADSHTKPHAELKATIAAAKAQHRRPPIPRFRRHRDGADDGARSHPCRHVGRNAP